MNDKFTVLFGCSEWQESKEFESLEEAQAFARGDIPSMGLYPPTYCYIENSLGETIEVGFIEEEPE